MALTDNLLAFYKLDNTNDSSGNNRTLTNNGNVSFASGKLGNAAVFDGSGKYLSKEALLTDENELTVSCFAYFNDTEELRTVWAKGANASDLDIVYYEGQLNYFVSTTEGGARISSNFVPNLNQWYHLTLTHSANSQVAKLFVDGQLVASTNVSGTRISNSVPFEIGANTNWGRSFNGQIDAVGIWNRALSDSEVAALYNSGTGLELEIEAPVVDLESGLQAFYKLSDTSDSSGNNRTLTNNGNVSFASGKLGNAAVFDGSNYLSIENSNTGESAVSFFCWANRSENSAFGMAGLESDGAWLLWCHDTLICDVNVGQGWVTGVNGVSPVPQNEWVHVGFIYNGTEMRLYINGLVDSVNSINGSFRSTNNFYIGKEGCWNTIDYNGQIDAVGIWNRALSDAEVAALYNSGTGLELPEAPAVKNGWIDNIFWINDVATSLDQNGNGTWVGKLYENGSLFSGSKYSLTFVAGVAQAEQIVTVIGNNIPVAYGLNEAEEPLVELVFASITSAGETVIEQIVPTVLPTGYTVAETVLAYSIDTTATFEGTINVDFILPSNISQAVFDRVKGFHVKNNGAIEEMARVSSDFSTKRITVAITSFSDFLFLDEPQGNKTVKVVGKSKFVGKVKFA